ncbi:hypothetical protein [Clostridium sp. L74]|uniref:hypothetical protein n=1 Tax=Clostridium sp. L74 TaxID=1560217 RepID=UPI0006ABC204|nr:hypothetical protein [Clostridium sp. L74]KOR25399.1 hypothetical protein ND00_17050 [Clostridium sp. L74]
MKCKKTLKSLLVSTLILGSVSTTAFAAATSLSHTSPCHTFSGYLNTKSGYAEASTKIEHVSSNKNANAYVYLESVNSSGYRQYATENYNKPKAYTKCSGYGASYYQSRHTVKDPQCQNKYLRLSK